MKFSRITALASGLLLTAAISASAQTWTKTGTPGNLPATAQVVTGVGPLLSITGSLTFSVTGSERTTAPVSNPDMYQILVDGGGTFSASTVGTDGTLFDSQLFLFDSSGKGVYMNDDDANAFGARSTLPLAINSTLSPLTPGIYYLAIAAFGANPASTSTANLIFPAPSTSTSFSGVYGPTGPGGSGSIGRWVLGGNDVETGSYTINLTGASFVPAPEPNSMVVLLLGGAGLALCMMRRRKSAARVG